MIDLVTFCVIRSNILCLEMDCTISPFTCTVNNYFHILRGSSVAQSTYRSRCSTKCLQTGRLCCRGFNPDLRQYASIYMMYCPCRLVMVYEMYACTEWNRQETKNKKYKLFHILRTLQMAISC